MMTEKVFKHLHEHKPIIINYGKGYFTDDDIKEKAYYNDDLQMYVSSTGIWGNKLLKQIFRGEIDNTRIELEEWLNGFN